MQLTFLILVLCSCLEKSTSISPPFSDSTWRPSRYIIDNRRNSLFSKSPESLLPQPQEYPPTESTVFRLKADSFKHSLIPFQRYQKDLSAEASIAGPKFYRKYGENALPRKIVKSLRMSGGLGDPGEFNYNVGTTGTPKNSSGVKNPHGFMQNEELNEVASRTAATTENMQPWMLGTGQDALTSVRSSTATASKDDRGSQQSEGMDSDSSTTTVFPWELESTKTEEGNQIDNPNEKHVYETRIETVSYHQEVIYNSPKKQSWLGVKQESEGHEPSEKNYEEPEKNYEVPEKNYEVPEKNFEVPEKNFEVPEMNYEVPEKNYELDEVMAQPADNEDNQNKFGYVVEGENYRKYRVEERTVDGFIVGEYGVVSHNDGSLRGVRYTADSNINPQLIYETLIKFLSL